MSPRVLIAALSLLLCPGIIRAQDESNDVPLGDVARIAREAKHTQEQPVIDNDNLHVMMDKAEAERLNGQPVFSIDPSGKTFRMTSPDGTCSLSFDAKATALISTPYVAMELPQYELLNLAGSATVRDGALEITLHNATNWEVKEIVVGITVLQNQLSPELMPAKLFAGNIEPAEKLPDATALYHLKATAAPDATTVFRGNVGDGLADVKDWHWALISARGIPPAAPGSVAAQRMAQPTGSAFPPPESAVPSTSSTINSAAPLPGISDPPGAQVPAPTPQSNPSSANPQH
jgi:hypothetical protein